MTDDLVVFLRARLDDTARKALAAADGGSGSWLVRGGLEVCRTESIDLPGMQPHHRAVVAGAAPAQLHHIAEHDPARVLAEVEAKRRIISQHLPVGTGSVCLSNCHTRAPGKSQTWPCLTLRLMALPHADHAGYKEAWRPGPLLTVTGQDYQPEWAPDGG